MKIGKEHIGKKVTNKNSNGWKWVKVLDIGVHTFWGIDDNGDKEESSYDLDWHLYEEPKEESKLEFPKLLSGPHNLVEWADEDLKAYCEKLECKHGDLIQDLRLTQNKLVMKVQELESKIESLSISLGGSNIRSYHQLEERIEALETKHD